MGETPQIQVCQTCSVIPHIFLGEANYLRYSLKKVGFQMFLEMGRDSAVLASGGSWFHHWGARTEKSWDWAERKVPFFGVGKAKRPEVAGQSARVGV